MEVCKKYRKAAETLQILHADGQTEESCWPLRDGWAAFVTEDSKAGPVWRGDPRLAMNVGKWIMAQTFSLCTVMEVNRDSQELGWTLFSQGFWSLWDIPSGLFATLIKTNMEKPLEANPTTSQLLKISTQQLKGRRGANSSFVWHGGLRKFERQIIQNKKQCKNRLGNYCAVTINDAIENINHSLASEACCERRIRRFYVPSTRKPQGPGA